MGADDVNKAATLEVDLQEKGDLVVLRIAGMAAVEVSGQLSRALQEAAGHKPKVLAVDLSGLNFVSSTGLGGLVAAHVTCERNNTQLVLVNPKKFIREILEITKLSDLFKICESLEEAKKLVPAIEEIMSSEDTTPQRLPVRRSVFFSGNVQGVGFRFTACSVARDFKICGTVKNLLDGRVQIVAEGLPDEIDHFISAVEDTMRGYIEYSSTTDSTASGEFTSFKTEY